MLTGWLWVVLVCGATFWIFMIGVGTKLLVEHASDSQYTSSYAWCEIQYPVVALRTPISPLAQAQGVPLQAPLRLLPHGQRFPGHGTAVSFLGAAVHLRYGKGSCVVLLPRSHSFSPYRRVSGTRR